MFLRLFMLSLVTASPAIYSYAGLTSNATSILAYSTPEKVRNDCLFIIQNGFPSDPNDQEDQRPGPGPIPNPGGGGGPAPRRSATFSIRKPSSDPYSLPLTKISGFCWIGISISAGYDTELGTWEDVKAKLNETNDECYEEQCSTKVATSGEENKIILTLKRLLHPPLGDESAISIINGPVITNASTWSLEDP